MGHEIRYLEFDYSTDRKNIVAKADRVYDHNCEYGGSTGGIDFHDLSPRKSYDEAVEWLEEKASGRFYYQGAVPYYEYPQFKASAKLDKLEERLCTANETYNKLNGARYLDTISSKFVTCKGCESKINREHQVKSYRVNYCPVCGTDFRPASTIAKIDAARKKSEELREAVKAETNVCREKQVGKAKKMWLVRIEYHV